LHTFILSFFVNWAPVEQEPKVRVVVVHATQED